MKNSSTLGFCLLTKKPPVLRRRLYPLLGSSVLPTLRESCPHLRKGNPNLIVVLFSNLVPSGHWEGTLISPWRPVILRELREGHPHFGCVARRLRIVSCWSALKPADKAFFLVVPFFYWHQLAAQCQNLFYACWRLHWHRVGQNNCFMLSLFFRGGVFLDNVGGSWFSAQCHGNIVR